MQGIGKIHIPPYGDIYIMVRDGASARYLRRTTSLAQRAVKTGVDLSEEERYLKEHREALTRLLEGQTVIV